MPKIAVLLPVKIWESPPKSVSAFVTPIFPVSIGRSLRIYVINYKCPLCSLALKNRVGSCQKDLLIKPASTPNIPIPIFLISLGMSRRLDIEKKNPLVPYRCKHSVFCSLKKLERISRKLKLYTYTYATYTVSKNDSDVAQHYFNAQLIFVIFGRDAAERVYHQTVICYPTSPN